MREISCQVQVTADERVSASVVAGQLQVWAEGLPGVTLVRVTVDEPRPLHAYWYAVQGYVERSADQGPGWWEMDPQWMADHRTCDSPEEVARYVLGNYLDSVKGDADDDDAVPVSPVRVLVWEGAATGLADEAVCVLRWNPDWWESPA